MLSKPSPLYDTSRLSDIPSMASAISNRIAVFNKQYRALLDAAVNYYQQYPAVAETLKKARHQLKITDNKLAKIDEYKKEHGQLPAVKGHASTEKLVNSLYRDAEQYKRLINDSSQTIIAIRSNQYQLLENLTDNMLDLLDNERIFSQFLGTMALSAPQLDDKNRCQLNERRKPIYIAALTVLLFDEVRRNAQFQTPYIKNQLDTLFNGKNNVEANAPLASLADELKMSYREELLKPLAKAAIIQTIGSYSPDVEALFGDDRYQILSTDLRQSMLTQTNEQSLDYLLTGIGIPHKAFNNHEEKDAFVSYESKKLKFIQSILLSKQQQQGELYNLLKIPQVYSSFMLSTKYNANADDVYEAYHVIEHGIHDNEYDAIFAKLFLKIVGKFPIGSGIYFISKRTKQIEKAIVSSLYPENPEEPICKQVTKNQIQSLTQLEIIVARSDNIYYQDVRYGSEFSPEFFATRYKEKFTWEANELWEVQIPARTFWKKEVSLEPERTDEQL